MVLQRFQGQSVYEAQWNISKAFDRVSHEKLIDQATELGYPLVLLRLSLLSCKFQRIFVTNGSLASDPVFPQRGIGPGSSFATLELAVLLIESLMLIQQQTPSCTLSVHVDDFALQASGANEPEARHNMVTLFAQVRFHIVEELKLPFSSDKAVLLGTCAEGCRLLAEQLGENHGQILETTRSLGYDYALNKDNNRQALKGRVWIAKKRMKQVCRLRTKLKSLVRVFMAGIVPTATFGT